MILLDTNVVSEPWRPQPERKVIAWLDAQDVTLLYICTPMLAELRYGAERLPFGQRRLRLENHINRIETEGFKDRILSFDIAAASAFGRLAALRAAAGKRIEPLDAMIAAIALVHGFQLATRDTGDFANLGIDLVNPFEVAADR